MPSATRRLFAAALALLLAAPAPSALAAGAGVYGPLELKPKDRELVVKSAEVEELFRRRGWVLPADGPETELVRRVGAAVTAHATVAEHVRFRFGVVRSEVPNAFALPDGQIYVHQGLLALLENEAQLAAVLAHEAMHVEGHHSILNARQARKKAGGMLALSILLGDVGSLINIAFVHAIIGYGRALEEEADRNAVLRVLDAGYDPREMPRVFDLLDEDPEGDQVPVKAAWSDHPLNVQREQYTREILDGMTARIAEEEQRRGSLRIGEDEFAGTVAGAAKDSIELYVDADRPRSALALAKRVAARWSDDPQAHVLLGEAYRALDARQAELPEDELTRKAKRARVRTYGRYTRQEREALRRDDPAASALLEGNWSRAEEAYREALRLQPDHPGALRGLGLLFEEKGELRQAGRFLADYLRAAPTALDRPVVLRHLSLITAELKAGDGAKTP